MGYNKCTVSLSLISNMMAISSYRRKIRSLYLFLFTFLTCLVLCKELPPPTGVVAKPLLSWVPEDFLACRRVLRCLPQYITRGLLQSFLETWPKPETAHEKSLAPRVSHFFLGQQNLKATKYYNYSSGSTAMYWLQVCLANVQCILGKVQFQRAAETVSQLQFRAVFIMQPRDPIFLQLVQRF